VGSDGDVHKKDSPTCTQSLTDSTTGHHNKSQHQRDDTTERQWSHISCTQVQRHRDECHAEYKSTLVDCCYNHKPNWNLLGNNNNDDDEAYRKGGRDGHTGEGTQPEILPDPPVTTAPTAPRMTTRIERSIKPRSRCVEESENHPTNKTTFMPEEETKEEEEEEQEAWTLDQELYLVQANFEINLTYAERDSYDAMKEFVMAGACIGGGFEDNHELHDMKIDEDMNYVDDEGWRATIDDEWNRMMKHGVFKSINEEEVPKGSTIIDLTWAMKKKPNGTLRARMAARGFNQVDVECFDSVSIAAPVMTMVSILLMMMIMMVVVSWHFLSTDLLVMDNRVSHDNVWGEMDGIYHCNFITPQYFLHQQINSDDSSNNNRDDGANSSSSSSNGSSNGSSNNADKIHDGEQSDRGVKSNKTHTVDCCFPFVHYYTNRRLYLDNQYEDNGQLSCQRITTSTEQYSKSRSTLSSCIYIDFLSDDAWDGSATPPMSTYLLPRRTGCQVEHNWETDPRHLQTQCADIRETKIEGVLESRYKIVTFSLLSSGNVSFFGPVKLQYLVQGELSHLGKEPSFPFLTIV